MDRNGERLGGIWGWRGILGYIAPSVFAMLGEDFYQVIPEGVKLVVVTLGMNLPSSSSEVNSALAGVEQAARQVAQAKPDFIFLGGVPLSIGTGFGHDREIGKRIEEVTGIPAMASLTASIEVLRTLSVKKLVIASPSPLELKQRYKEYMEASGFEVLCSGGPEVPKNSDKRKLPPHVPYEAAKAVFHEAPGADAIYMPCGSWGVSPAVVELIERDVGKPVVSSHQSFIWAGLRALKIKEPPKGFGMLFQTL